MTRILKNFKILLFLIFILCGRADAASYVTFPESWDVGQAFAVCITSDKDYSDPTVTWLNRTVTLDVEKGGSGKISYGLLGSYVSKIKPGNYPIVFEFTQGDQRYRVEGEIKLNPRQYPREELHVKQRMITPSKKVLPRIRREAQLAGNALKTMTTERKWKIPPNAPLSVMTLTSHYGFQRVYNGVPRNGHAAADLRAAVGTNVRAPFAGKVILTGNHYYAGGSIYVDSGNGVITVFFHLSKINVKVGQRVAVGQVLGKSGSTGRVTGPHLHYGLNLAGQYVDPMPLFETDLDKLLAAGQTALVAD